MVSQSSNKICKSRLLQMPVCALRVSKFSEYSVSCSGADDALNKQDFAKDLGNAITGMADGCFDADLFGSVSDEALKDGLGHLDFDGFQMLTDPTMVTDPDTENSFRLDQLS